MARRPVFLPGHAPENLVIERSLEFQWHPGFALSQKRKCITSLHDAAAADGIKPVLEVSTKSPHVIGHQLSAFNLSLSSGRQLIAIECIFQSAKVFENGGPYLDLLQAAPGDAKRDPRLRASGRLIAFEFEGQRYPTEPLTGFYDWIYCRALTCNPQLAEAAGNFAGFTDIEFNPERSLNCQARSLATAVALQRNGCWRDALADFDTFAQVVFAR